MNQSMKKELIVINQNPYPLKIDSNGVNLESMLKKSRNKKRPG
jgi:hypothetical protein